MALHLRGRLPPGARRIHHPALRDLYPLRGLHHARIDAPDPALQRHAVVAVDGLRPRDGQHAHTAGEPAAALVPALLEARGRHGRVAAAGLHLPRHRLVLGDRGAAHRLHRHPAGARAHGAHAGRARHAHVVRQQAAREFCGRHELRDLPDVLRLIRPLSAVAGERRQPPALLCVPVQSVHPRGRVGALCALRRDQLAVAGGGDGMHGAVHGGRDPRLRPRARAPRAARRAGRRSMRARLLCALVVAAMGTLTLHGEARATDPRFPDWPCNQLKVPELSVAAVWAGPAIDDVGNAWEDDPAVRDLVARIAARRTSLDDAQAAIANFVTGSEAERQQKARLVFAGVFKTLDRERGQVMEGIERYTRKQKEFADQIRSNALALHQLQDQPQRDQDKIDAMTEQLEWDTRIFDERRKTIGFVCEVPVRIEQRLFTLARAIQQALD